MRDTREYTCIDIIRTDQPNHVLDRRVRDSLDVTVKHKIVFCKINRAREKSIKTAITMYPGEKIYRISILIVKLIF